MPLLTQPPPPSQRRRPWLWALLGAPGVLALLIIWSLVVPVRLETHSLYLLFGRFLSQSHFPNRSYVTADWRKGQFNIDPLPRWGKREYELPDKYVVQWRW